MVPGTDTTMHVALPPPTTSQARLALISHLLSLSYLSASMPVFSFPVMPDSLPECELPCPINAQNVGIAKGLEHLDIVPLVVGVGAAAVTAILTPILAPVFLTTLGFSAVGPVAGKSEIPTLRPHQLHKKPNFSASTDLNTPSGTAAAGIQAGIGNVVAGSLFATVQSIAMGGAVPVVITVVSAGVTGITAAVVTVGFGSRIHSMATAAASAIIVGGDAVVNATAAAVTKYGPNVVSFGKDAGSAIGTGIDTVANVAAGAAEEFGPSVLSKGEAVASAMGEGVGVVTDMTAAAADDLKPSIISIGKTAASAFGAGIGAIANMIHKDV